MPSNDWKIVLLHSEKDTLLKRAFETSFGDRVLSLHVPALGEEDKYGYRTTRGALMSYFRRQVYDSGIWNGRVLTVYGNGEFHHSTYALTQFARERRGLGYDDRDWTYFHFDQHRDDWGRRRADGEANHIDCASFVDQIAYHHQAVPFMVGPTVYAKKDSQGYRISGQEIPIYSNQFPKSMQESKGWRSNEVLHGLTDARRLPSRRDLQETPTESYLSFDLDLLSPTEIVTNYDQNEHVTLRSLVPILERVREYKRIFSADILGFPDECSHPLSVLTMLILARKIMGMSMSKLFEYHSYAKRRQAGLGIYLGNTQRESPIVEGELMELLKWAQ
jgi:hypothetical protein